MILLYLIIVIGSASSQKADYLIISQPASQPLLDKYEQRLGTAQLARLPQFLPFRVLQRNVTLSDDYTVADKIEHKGEIFFLLGDAVGAGRTGKESPGVQFYKNVITVSDTIMILEEDMFALRNPDPADHSIIKLSLNSTIVRIFKHRSDYYVMVPGPVNRYGWIRFPNNKYWTKSERIITQADTQKEDAVFATITSKTSQVNNVFDRLFTVLNDRTGSGRIIPQWEIRQTETTLELRFVPSEYHQSFIESNSRFIQEIEYLLLGSKYKLTTYKNPNRYLIYAP